MESGTSSSPIPRGEVRRLLQTLVVQEPECSCHFSNFLIAESSGEPGAGLSGYDPASVAGVGQALAFAFESLVMDGQRLMAAFQRLASFQSCAPDQTPGVWIIEWVATQPEFRRRGFADLLLREIVARGKERGYSAAQIATFVENQNAIEAYKKVGFSVAEERTDGRFERVMGSRGMVIMKLDLEAS